MKLEKNVDKTNGTKSSMTDMKKRVLLRKEIYQLENSELGTSEEYLLRYLPQISDGLLDKKPCTKEFFWSKKSSRSDRTLKVPENCGLYYFKWESE